MEFLIRQLGRIKKPQTFIIALVFILSISWFADGFAGIVKLILEVKLLVIALSLFLSLFSGFIYRLIKRHLDKENALFLSVLFSVLIVSAFALIIFLINFEKDKDNLLSFIQFSLSLSVFFTVWLFIKDLGQLRFSVKEVSPKKIKGLVMFLSYWDKMPSDFSPDDFKCLEDFYSYQDQLSKKGKRTCPWEMQLRILEKYNEIEYVYVIGSQNGSYNQIQFFEQLVNKFFPNLKIIILNQAIDFENLEENILAIEEAFRNLKEKGLKDNEILIDTTGGQKVQSIAGAFYSLSYDRYFVYVSTNSKEVKVFDVIIRETEGG